MSLRRTRCKNDFQLGAGGAGRRGNHNFPTEGARDKGQNPLTNKIAFLLGFRSPYFGVALNDKNHISDKMMNFCPNSLGPTKTLVEARPRVQWKKKTEIEILPHSCLILYSNKHKAQQLTLYIYLTCHGQIFESRCFQTIAICNRGGQENCRAFS